MYNEYTNLKEIIRMRLNENIRNFREQNGMTQTELASALHVTPQSVSRWENGLAYPDIEKLPQLADLFGVSVDELLGVPANTAYDLTKRLKTAREKERNGTNQDKLEYLSLLEKGFRMRANTFLCEYLCAARRLRNEGVIPNHRYDEISESVKARLAEIPLPHRNRMLTNIVIREDEEQLNEWKSFITDDNNFACWHDLVLFRYFVNGNEHEWSLQRSEVLFQDISKTLYHMNQKSSPSSLDMLHRKYDSVEACLSVKRIIDVYSVRDDDIFISLRINAEVRLAATYFYTGLTEQFCESLERMKELLAISRSLVGKRITGSTELFENYGFEYSIERFSNDYFEIEFLLDGRLSDEYKALPVVNELVEQINAARGSVDPFCSIEQRYRRSLETMYNIVKKRCASAELKENQTLFVFAAMMSKGNIYDFAFDINDKNGYSEIIAFFKRAEETQITYIVGALHDKYNDCCVEVPPHDFREALCDLDKRNLDTRTLLNANYFYTLKTFRETMSPNLLMKYEE